MYPEIYFVLSLIFCELSHSVFIFMPTFQSELNTRLQSTWKEKLLRKDKRV